MRKYNFLPAIIVLFCFLLAGCGKNESALYTEQMNTFYDNVTSISASINAINPESDTAQAELLEYLGSMQEAFAGLEHMNVPDEFQQNTDLGQRASVSMQQAVIYYQQAFKGENFQSDLAAEAQTYYENAMNYASAMGKVMMGYEINIVE